MKKSALLLAIVVGACLTATVSAPDCFAATWYVDLNGSDSNAGTQAAPFATPYKAVSAVRPGDTIDIDGGTYILDSAEAPYTGNPVTVATSGTASAPITIQSTPRQSAVLDATGLTLGTTDGIDVQASYVVVQNLTIQNSAFADLYFISGNYDTARNCDFNGGGVVGVTVGIWGDQSAITGDSIVGCAVYGNCVTAGAGGAAVNLQACENCLVQSNAIYANLGPGIDISPSEQSGIVPTTNCRISNNTFYDNQGSEISMVNVQNISVADNLIYADENAASSPANAATGINCSNWSTVWPCASCQILNNIVIGGALNLDLHGNTSTYVTTGGFSNFRIDDNVFYNGYSACVGIDYDPNNTGISFCNNILWELSNSTPIDSYDSRNPAPTARNNCVDGNGASGLSGTGSLHLSNVDPGFMGSGGFVANDYALQPSSPCIDAGINVYSVDWADYNGAPMPAGGAWNMGPFAPTATPANNGGKLIPAGFLHTHGNQIVDNSGNPVRIASVGWTGGNGFDGYPIGLWSVSYKTTMNAIVADGFNCIRYDWCNANLHTTDPADGSINYSQNPDLVGLTTMQIQDKIIAYAGQIGLRVILCHHVDEGLNRTDQQPNGLWYDLGPGTDGTDGAGDTGTVTAQSFKNDWVYLAQHYAGNSTVIGFDLDNEPLEGDGWGSNWGLGGPTDIRTMFETVGNAIHAVNPGVLIICEGPVNVAVDQSSPLWLTMDLTHVATKPVVLNVSNKVVYSPHEYPNEVSTTNNDSGPIYFNRLNTDWGYIYTQNIAPIWVGEMGEALTPTDTDGNTWFSSIMPYLNGLDGAEGGPAYDPADEPISTDWWFWGTFNDSDPWSNGTLLDWYPTVYNPCSTAASDNLLWVKPQIVSLSETSGSPGDSITITGSGYYAIKSVTFNSVPAAYTATGPTSIVTTAPATATTGFITVTTSAGKAVSPKPFRYINPAVSSIVLAPTKIVGGSTSTATVTLSSIASGSGRVVTISSSNLSAASVPSSTITVPAGSNSAQFVVSSAPVATTTTAMISAMAEGVTKKATLTIKP